MAKFCGLCDIDISGETWNQHNVSESHKHNSHQRECSIELEIEGGWIGTTQSDLLVLFQSFGPVLKINMHGRQYPPAGLGMIQFSKPESVKKVLQQTFYKMGTDRPDSRHHLLKVTRWLPQKQRHSNEELDERERSLSAEKERKFQEDLYNTVKMAGTTELQITQLAWMQELTASEQKLAEEFRADIEGILQSYIPEVKVHLIGSCNNGLGARGCDMNFEIAFDPRAQRPVAEFLPQPPPLPMHMIKQIKLEVKDGRVVYTSLRQKSSYIILWLIYEILSKSNLSLKLSQLELHKNRKTGLVQYYLNYLTFRYLKVQIDCEIHVKLSESINCYNQELTSLLVKLDDRVRPLYLTLRYWAKKYQIFHHISSAGLFLFVYQYLQTLKPPILPSVETLASLLDRNNRKVARGYDVSFCTDVIRIKERCFPTTNVLSLPELLQGFFKYYTKFDLSNRVFCPRTGKGYNMLKFRNMKKIMPTLARYPIGGKQLHIQDIFKIDTNVIEQCSVVGKHLVCAEIIRAEVLTRGPTKSWNLFDLIPDDPLMHGKRQSSVTHITIPFLAASLPDGFLIYQSYTEAENQWYQWIVEIVMRCLKILRITYQLEGDYGAAESKPGEKRQLLDDPGPHKKGNWSSIYDEERARDFSGTYVPAWDMVQESILMCKDQHNLWRTRSARASSSKHGMFEFEERVTEKQLQERVKTPEKFTVDEISFLLKISLVKSLNETQVDIRATDLNYAKCFNKFFEFFHEFLGRKIGVEIGMGLTSLFDTF